MLNTVKGCTPFEDIRTVDGVIHPTYKSACSALGFLDDDNKWIECINESSNWASGQQLRLLFTTILCPCEVTDTKLLWESTLELLLEDIEHTQRRIMNYPTLQLMPSQKRHMRIGGNRKNNETNWKVTEGLPRNRIPKHR